MKPRLPFLLAVMTLTLQHTTAYWKGFNIKSNLADGVTCKSLSDWREDFAVITSFPNKINSARLYSSWSCNTLTNAVPASISYGKKILVGIDVSGNSNYEYEKDALLSAINKYGWSWILAVSVGSEDLYRGDSNVSSLVTQINDVRGMLKSTPSYPTSGIKVGHVDTSNIWTETSTYPLTRACDFVGVDSYPYFQATQNNSISNAGNLFREGIAGVKTAVSKAGSTASVWVAETGWPVNGSTKGLAVAGRENARAYWSDVACSSFDTEVGEGGVNIWWFTLQDWSAYPSFAVVDPEFEVEYDLSC